MLLRPRKALKPPAAALLPQADGTPVKDGGEDLRAVPSSSGLIIKFSTALSEPRKRALPFDDEPVQDHAEEEGTTKRALLCDKRCTLAGGHSSLCRTTDGLAPPSSKRLHKQAKQPTIANSNTDCNGSESGDDKADPRRRLWEQEQSDGANAQSSL